MVVMVAFDAMKLLKLADYGYSVQQSLHVAVDAKTKKTKRARRVAKALLDRRFACKNEECPVTWTKAGLLEDLLKLKPF